MEIDRLLEFDTRARLRRWLVEHHAVATHCWVACSRARVVPDGVLPYLDVVEEALCFGWIDSTVKSLGDGRVAQRLSPRRKRSHWTELNRQRYRDLERRGLMTDAGRRALP